MKGGPDDIDEDQHPADGHEQDVKSRNAGTVVDESDAESQEDPTHHVVANARGQHRNADRRAQQIELREDAAEDGERRDGERGADEEGVHAKVDGHHAAAINVVELVIQPPGDGAAQAEG